MRQFDACSLCLQRARDPMACQRGHIYCRECVLSDLLAQKKDIKRHQTKLEAMAREEEEQKVLAKAAARERVLLDFEKKHLGLSATPRRIGSGAEADSTSTDGEAEYHPAYECYPKTQLTSTPSLQRNKAKVRF